MKLKKHVVSRYATALLVAVTITTSAVGGADYYVAPGGTGDYTQGNPGGSPIVAAQMATASGDVIHLGTGLYEYESDDVFAFRIADGVELVGGGDNPEELK